MNTSRRAFTVVVIAALTAGTLALIADDAAADAAPPHASGAVELGAVIMGDIYVRGLELEHYLADVYRAQAAAAWLAQVARARSAPSSRAGAPTRSGTGDATGALAAIRQCESGGNYNAVSPGGQYRGAYQFDQRTWEGVGGQGDPAAAPPAEQDARAADLYAQRGAAPWPTCGR